jgi:hypothetical protein
VSACQHLIDGRPPGRAEWHHHPENAVEYGWGLDNGLTVDPERCRRIAAALAPALAAAD